MNIGKKLRDRKLAALLAAHPAGTEPTFHALAQNVCAALPDLKAEAVYAAVVFCWEFVSETKEMQKEHDRIVIEAERQRIRKIVAHGLDHDCWPDALNLALTTELSAADAFEILDGKQTAGIIRAN